MPSQIEWFYNLDIMLVLLLIIQGIQVTKPFYISDTKSTWTNAVRNCTLAMPTLDYDTLLVDIPNESIKENLWVGYYLEATAFEYIGCMHTGSYKADVLFNSTRLAHCQGACGRTTYVGINRTACFCIAEKPTTNIRHLNCTDTCNLEIACGGKGYISLYKAVKEPENITKQPGLCLRFENNNNEKHFVWNNCSSFIKTICSFDNGTVRLLDKNSRPWSSSVQECLRHKGQSTSYEKSLKVVNGTGPVWTGLVRGKVIYGSNLFGESAATKYGFVSKNSDGHIYLRFGELTQKLRALCKEDIDTNRNYSLDIDNSRNDSLAVGVGVSVPVALAVIVLVIVFVILKRRGTIPSICKGKAMTQDASYDNTTINQNVTSSLHVNRAYDDHDVADRQERVNRSEETNHASYAYCVLDKHAKEPEDENATYDTTLAGQCTTDIENISVYNTVNSDDSTTYDCTVNTRKKEAHKNDDTYNSFEEAKSKYTSGKTNQVDDTYNHINENKQQRSEKTDNVYGLSDQFINSIGNAENGQSDGETYNHLNSMTVINTKPDNVYGISND